MLPYRTDHILSCRWSHIGFSSYRINFGLQRNRLQNYSVQFLGHIVNIICFSVFFFIFLNILTDALCYFPWIVSLISVTVVHIGIL